MTYRNSSPSSSSSSSSQPSFYLPSPHHSSSSSSSSSSAASAYRAHPPPSMANRFAVDQRQALFSSFQPKQGGSGGGGRGGREGSGGGGMGGGASKYGQAAVELMEAENDDAMVDLESKVQDLKSVSLAMRGEVQESNRILSTMGSQFDAVGNLMGGTLAKLKALVNGRSGRHIWYMMLFAVLMIIVLYMIYSRR
eukprot:GHVQ01041677.1.p1 GENE.GHVQ01041677.1~~GHVQ01041677.1.p1  ORF type:complete len:195 (-),score=49.32 GHVQ01041677.1:202-786(-)